MQSCFVTYVSLFPRSRSKPVADQQQLNSKEKEISLIVLAPFSELIHCAIMWNENEMSQNELFFPRGV